MPRKLKTYQTSQGFYDLAVATPSMKAALEAWGSKQNLFHQGFAKETDDSEVVAAAMAKPGVVLRRPVGSDQPFREHADLPMVESLDTRPRKAKFRAAKEYRRRLRLTKTKRARPHSLMNENRSGGRGSARKKRLRRPKSAHAVMRLCKGRGRARIRKA
jgi:colicin import membrane protein